MRIEIIETNEGILITSVGPTKSRLEESCFCKEHPILLVGFFVVFTIVLCMVCTYIRKRLPPCSDY